MRPRDILSGLVAALALGLAFIAIKIGVGQTPPLLLTALRFLFAAVPAIFFVARPKAPARTRRALWIADRGRRVRPDVSGDRAWDARRPRLACHPAPGLHHSLSRLGAFARAADGDSNERGEPRVPWHCRDRLGPPWRRESWPFLLVIAAALCWGAAGVCRPAADMNV